MEPMRGAGCTEYFLSCYKFPDCVVSAVMAGLAGRLFQNLFAQADQIAQVNCRSWFGFLLELIDKKSSCDKGEG